MPSLNLKVHHLDRSAYADHAAVHTGLRDLLFRTLARQRGLPPAAVVVRARAIDLVDLKTVRAAGMPLDALLAGLSATDTEEGGRAECVGLMGQFSWNRTDRRGRTAHAPIALVFVERHDGAWWQWQALMTPERDDLVEAGVLERSAHQGDPLPDGLGRWWTRQRRRPVNLGLRRTSSQAPQPGVH